MSQCILLFLLFIFIYLLLFKNAIDVLEVSLSQRFLCIPLAKTMKWLWGHRGMNEFPWHIHTQEQAGPKCLHRADEEEAAQQQQTVTEDGRTRRTPPNPNKTKICWLSNFVIQICDWKKWIIIHPVSVIPWLSQSVHSNPARTAQGSLGGHYNSRAMVMAKQMELLKWKI